LVVQLDAASGAIEWTAGHTQPEDGLVAVEAGRNGEWWVSGVHTHYPSGPIHSEIVLRRFDASGALVSSTSWSGFPPSPGSSEYSYPAGMVVGTAGQAWVLGNSSSTLMSTGFNQRESALLLLGPDGALSWSESLTASLGPDAGVGDLQRCPSDRLAAVGVVLPTSPSFHSDILTTQFDVSDSPQAYCTAKTTSAGCVPATSFTGMPSASASSGFVVSCSQVRNQKNGLVFYGVNGSANLPFQGGTLCVAVPQVRTPIQSSGGNPSPADDCSGSFALDMNAYASGALGGAPLPALSVAGTTVHCQFWGRDPGFAPPQNTMLSNGLRYVVLP
jgi:hypothetical protein